ncbi:hypothetical protein [Fodinibius sediminis]|uniref:Membrane domain of glycerophosphoryl diester phosphodiesterase n=1 Tax=Fodinibius sediminis TaxID=1214077 RepID=A0A521C9H2_9BACT|nr:hypothetical protein [Fodinibius sediminis]SMO55471.1 hypothetical protein SAMN06265218_105130 [Fodinibius sediminis]
MKQSSIDLVQLFKFSFNQYKQYASFVIGITITYYVLAIIPQVYFMIYSPENPTLKTQVLSAVLTVLQLFLSLGFIKIMLLLIDDEFVTVSDMFNNFPQFLSYFIAYFLYLISVLVGLALFVLPGIFIAIRFQFYPYFILEGTSSSISALQQSYYKTEGLTLELLLFGITVIILNILGALFFGIGIIFTYPLTTMATAVIYKSLIAGTAAIPSGSYREQIG